MSYFIIIILTYEKITIVTLLKKFAIVIGVFHDQKKMKLI